MKYLKVILADDTREEEAEGLLVEIESQWPVLVRRVERYEDGEAAS